MKSALANKKQQTRMSLYSGWKNVAQYDDKIFDINKT